MQKRTHWTQHTLFVAAAVALAAAPGTTRAQAGSGSSSSSTVEPMGPPGMRIPSGMFGGPSAFPDEVPPPPPSGTSGAAGGALLFERLDDDYFVTLDLFNRTRIGPVTFGLWVPLRFRVIDNPPADDGVFRKRDWDEPSDYARLLYFVEVNLAREQWMFRGRFGALEGESLGHGTVLAGYFNSLDRDHYQAGLVLAGAVKKGGVQIMLDNLLAPEIFGLRLYARPTAFFSDNPWGKRLVVGTSVTSDVHAPEALLADPNVPTGQPPRPLVDERNNFERASSAGVTILGVDAEYAVLRNQLLDLVPYADLNFLFAGGAGAGFHLGTFFNFRIPWKIGPTLMARLEYRALGTGYAPRYFDTLYEAQRLQYDPGRVIDPITRLPLTKLGWLHAGGTGHHGWLGELYFDFAGWVIVGGSYEDYTGPDNAALTLSLLLPKIPLVKVGALYSHRGFDTIDQAFDKNGALLLAFAQLNVFGPAYVSASYSRTWRANEDGSYTADGNFSVGAGVAFTY